MQTLSGKLHSNFRLHSLRPRTQLIYATKHYKHLSFSSHLFHHSIVSTTKGDKILTKEEFNTYNMDGKIDVVYGTRMKQGGGEMKDYNDITYVLKD